jgi:hypothetical protein
MALGTEMVDLVGFYIVDDIGYLLAVREVAIMEKQAGMGVMGIRVDVVDP